MVFFTLCCTASSGFFSDNTTTTIEIDSTGLPRLVLSVSRAHCVLFLQQHHGDTVRVLLWSIPFSRVWLLCFLVFFLRKELQCSFAYFSANNPTRHSSVLLRSIPFLRLLEAF
ncbi:hypothetical protein GmHk_01G001807 [Glycine max]|nr:hypothetical protein GmHk_01G001807 [Glycine max]